MHPIDRLLQSFRDAEIKREKESHLLKHFPNDPPDVRRKKEHFNNLQRKKRGK